MDREERGDPNSASWFSLVKVLGWLSVLCHAFCFVSLSDIAFSVVCLFQEERN